MATSRISNTTTLSSSIHERRQVQARIRALQHRTNTLYEELSRSSSVTTAAVFDIERAYMTITDEFREQRAQLLNRLQHVKQNIKQSTNELNGIRKNLNTTQSFRLPLISPRYSTDIEAHEMNSTVDDIERVLNNIAHQLKQVRFIPSNGHAMGKTLGTIRINDDHMKEIELTSRRSDLDQYYSLNDLSIYKLYTVDLDISAQWVITSIDKRIFLCDNEGKIRIYSYSRQLHRQPLLTERFRLSTIRLISSFTVTQDYLIAFETDTQNLTLHTHHGALLLHFYFPYNPTMIIRCNYHKKNQIWTCSRTKRQCYQFNLNHTRKEIKILDQLDFTKPISNIFVEPVGISSDEQNRIAIHDINSTTTDRLILFTNQQNMIIPLDFIKYPDTQFSSHIKRILLVPKQPHLIIIVYAPQFPITNLHEILFVNINLEPPEILYRLTEINGIQNLDFTLNNELVYTVTSPANKRIPPKMHIYNLIN